MTNSNRYINLLRPSKHIHNLIFGLLLHDVTIGGIETGAGRRGTDQGRAKRRKLEKERLRGWMPWKTINFWQLLPLFDSGILKWILMAFYFLLSFSSFNPLFSYVRINNLTLRNSKLRSNMNSFSGRRRYMIERNIPHSPKNVIKNELYYALSKKVGVLYSEVFNSHFQSSCQAFWMQHVLKV